MKTSIEEAAICGKHHVSRALMIASLRSGPNSYAMYAETHVDFPGVREALLPWP
jgi:hypothetical protein